MSIYWEHSVSGVQAEDFDMDKEDEDCEIQKPQIQSTEDEKQMKDLAINIILILELHTTDKSIGNNCKSEDLGCKDLKMICQGY
jgi:hypothetical protein